MDINRLRYFSVIARTESMVKAAEMLHLSPAALSKAMNTLEDELGIPLLVRVGRGISVTDQGKTLLPQIQNILLEVDRLHDPSSRIEPASRLRIASFEVFTTHFLKTILSNLKEPLPIDLYELAPGKMEEAVANGEADFCVTYLPVPHPLLTFTKISQVDMGVFVKAGAFKDANLETLPFAVPITPLHGNPNKVMGLDGWPDDELPRLHAYRVTLMESAMEIARQGLAAVYLPKFVAVLHNQKAKPEYILRELDDIATKKINSKFPIYLAKRKVREEDKIERQLAAALRKLNTN